jgi:hypothetical protein
MLTKSKQQNAHQTDRKTMPTRGCFFCCVLTEFDGIRCFFPLHSKKRIAGDIRVAQPPPVAACGGLGGPAAHAAAHGNGRYVFFFFIFFYKKIMIANIIFPTTLFPPTKPSMEWCPNEY